jgi:hypothetical protein
MKKMLLLVLLAMAAGAVHGQTKVQDIRRMLLDFYDSGIGRKSIRVMPEMTRESMRLGQEWGKALGEKIYEEMKKAGYVNT